jgi:hypothetical protein
MITIHPITTLDELITLMPFFMEGYHAMNRKQKVFDIDKEAFTKVLIGVLNTVPENGILVAFDGINPVGYGVAYNDTPTYSEEKHLLLYALYARPEFSRSVAPMIVSAAEVMAKQQGYTKMQAFNSRFSGASLRLFEKVFGMRRSRIQFTKEIK